MSIRIVHTADNHIGLSFRQYPAIREKLVEERFAALGRIVDFANERQAHFLVVAGDLFDKQAVSQTDIRKTAAILKRFSGMAVLVLAGNHDFYEGAENKLWQEFARASQDYDAIHLLLDQGIHSFTCGEEKIHFYACPCPSMHSREPVTGWVKGTPKTSGEWHIGLAHGNVEGIGMDADQRYFNMTQQDLRDAGLHTWLLGHIHVPWPNPGFSGNPPFFMPGIHTPDSVKVKHGGHAWYLELEQGKNIRFESFRPGAIAFERIAMEFSRGGKNAEALQQELQALRSGGLILDLVLSGRLPAEERSRLAAWLSEKSSAFLHLSWDLNDVREELNSAQLSRHWPEGSLPYDLIRDLMAANPDGDDAQLAMELLEKTRNQ